METVFIIISVVAILAYYGFMRSFEVAANMVNREIKHAEDVHDVSLISRTARLSDRLSDSEIEKATKVKAQIQAMRERL